jgi:hypothetical protein
MKKKTKIKKLKKAAPKKLAKRPPKMAAKKAGPKPIKKAAAKPANKPVKAAATRTVRSPRKVKEVSSGTLRSSLTSNITLSSRDEDLANRGGQSGDLQGISRVADADSESVEELLEDGQALEAEVVEGVEDVPDEKPVPSRGRIEEDSVPDYDDREKI